MDSIDYRLLDVLQTDGKTSYSTLGQAVGLSISAVDERLKKLQSAGVLRGYAALVDPETIGLGVCGFVQILITDPAREEGLLRTIEDFPEVQECHCITGDFSYLLKVRATSPRAFEDFLRGKIKTIAGVVRTHSLIVLTTYKETPALPLPSAAGE